MQTKLVALVTSLGLAGLCLLPLRGAEDTGWLLVYRTESGIGLTEAYSVRMNGKEDVLLAGPDAGPSLPLNKLPKHPIEKPAQFLWNSASRTPMLLLPGGRQFLAPAGLKEKTISDPAAVWSAVPVVYKLSRDGKEANTVSGANLLALVPLSPAAVVDLAFDHTSAELIQGEGHGYEFQAGFLAAALESKFGGQPAADALRRRMETEMARRLSLYQSIAGDTEALAAGLEYAKISGRLFPEDPAQKRIRDDLAQARERLDRRLAILKALFDGGETDSFLQAYRDFERVQWRFPEMVDLLKKGLAQSIAFHNDRAMRFAGSHDFRRAYQELKTARSLNPTDLSLRDREYQAWENWSQEVARSQQNRGTQLTPGQRAQRDQYLQMAERYQEQKQLEMAIENVRKAEQIQPDGITVQLTKARVLAARGELGQALEALDKVDLQALDEEREKARHLRTELLFRLEMVRKQNSKQLDELIDRAAFHKAYRLAIEGVKADAENPEFLYFGGLTALATRRRDEGVELLKRYLAVRITVETKLDRRRSVIQLLEQIPPDAGAATTGEPHWFSGRKLNPNNYYCPISLAFAPAISEVTAKNDTVLRFQWQGGRVLSIEPAALKPGAPAPRGSPFYFVYSTALPQVRQVTNSKPAGPGGAGLVGLDSPLQSGRSTTITSDGKVDPDEDLVGSNVILLNNPWIDPAVAELVSRKKVAYTVAGNAYFHPFVWDKLHLFALTYDETGRVRGALDVSPDEPEAGRLRLEFDWKDDQLQTIRGYSASASSGAPIYRRDLVYEGERLSEERIEMRGKSGKIRYKYDRGALVSAECDDDASPDGLSRKVSFVRGRVGG